MAKWTHSGWESCTFLAILAQFFGVVPGGVSLSNIRILQLSSSKVTSHWLDIVSSGRPPIVNCLWFFGMVGRNQSGDTRRQALFSRSPHDSPPSVYLLSSYGSQNGLFRGVKIVRKHIGNCPPFLGLRNKPIMAVWRWRK